jgi:hypothetical protein
LVNRSDIERLNLSGMLTVDDLLFGFPFGLDPVAVTDEGWSGPALTPHAAMRHAVLPALLDGPCRVSFSGGRDSSTVLAVAVDVAREHGLPLPVPVTFRHPSPASDEREWQELVLRHLGMTEHVVINVTDELALDGPYAARAWGLLGTHWPANAHGHLLLAEAAGIGPAGSLMTGWEGDGLLSHAGLASLRRPGRRVRRAVGMAAPRRMVVARRARRARSAWSLAWLEAEDRASFRRLYAGHITQSRRWDVHARTHSQQRSVRLGAAAITRLMASVNVTGHHPLEDRMVIEALAHAGGATGPATRAHAHAWLAADLLPPTVLARVGKATFSEMYEPTTSITLDDPWSPLLGSFAAPLTAALLHGPMSDDPRTRDDLRQ